MHPNDQLQFKTQINQENFMHTSNSITIQFDPFHSF